MIGNRPLRLAALASLIWRIGLLPGEITSCGPVGPHRHELIGRVRPSALLAHLEAEAACGTGETLAALDITALLPPTAAPDLPATLWTCQRPACWAGALPEHPPPCPPPDLSACTT